MSHCSFSKLDLGTGQRKVVLVGNPNTGKSVVFHGLTGVYVDVSNYPGTTVDVFMANVGADVIIDTPGVYGISSFNDEERVTRDVVLEADIIVNIVNATQLERDLFLTLQLADMGIPMVVGVNMIDEAERLGLKINFAALEDQLGVPIIPLVATEQKGIPTLLESLARACPANGDLEIVAEIPEGLPRRSGLLVVEDDSEIAASLGVQVVGLREKAYMKRRQRVNQLVRSAVHDMGSKSVFSQRIGHWMVSPLTGIPILLFSLYLMYQFIGVFVAQTVVELTEGVLMAEYLTPGLLNVFSGFVSETSFWGNILIGEFGLITMTIAYIFGLLLPLVLGFYFMLAILEDSGYLPRIATLLDRLLMGIGLNGRAVIPMILGFGCVTMAVITTRVLGSRRERIISTFLLSLAIPCSAQLGVIVALLAPLGPSYALLYLGFILGVYILVGTLLNRIIPGESTDLLIDLPAIRLPRMNNVLQKTWHKTYHFLKEASPLFAVGSILISVMDWTGLLVSLQGTMAPLIQGWLRLPKETATAFIMGIVRRDFGAAGLFDMSLTPAQTIVALVTITLFVPCIASVIVIWKERGWKEWLGIFAGTFTTAFLVGGLIARIVF